MSTQPASPADRANRAFRRGLVIGAAAGFILFTLNTVAMIIVWHEAADESPSGRLDVLNELSHKMNVSIGLGYLIAGTCLLALVGGVIGIIASKVFSGLSR